MTIEVTGADVLEQQIEAMANRLEHGGDQIAAELVAWQIEDMRRRYPNVQRPAENAAVTLIWPRSRIVDKPRRDRRRAIVTSKRVRGGGRRLAYSTRPILRVELFDKLKDRMMTMLKRITKP
jgi:hypothetical protein